MDLKNKTVAVSGGSGFLGRRIVQELEGKGANVIAPRSKDYDFRDENKTSEFFNTFKPDIFIHSAALYGGLGINESIPAEIYDYNMRMMLNVFKGAIDWSLGKPKIEKMVAIGSACGYPGRLGTNMREELMWEGPVDKSVMNYGTIKKLIETTGSVYRNQFGLNSINLQLATLYGENDTFNPQRSHVPAAFIRKFVEAKQNNASRVEHWGFPDQIREFMYVGDAAQGIVMALEKFDGLEDCNDQSKYTLNIGTGQGITIDELSETIRKIVGYNGEVIYTSKSPGQKEKSLVVERMERVLNWYPPNSLEKGMKKTIEWYLANKESADKRF
jgi:GDP-L-fucose synthase